MSNLLIKFFPDQDYVVNFFENYEVAFSAPFVFNDCFESYTLPSKENPTIKSDLQILLQSEESALCFCCSRLNNRTDLASAQFELMWAHYASSHCGIGVIFEEENAFSYLEQHASNASEETEKPMRSASAQYSYCYNGIEIQYVDSNQINNKPIDNFNENSSLKKLGTLGQLINNPAEFGQSAENTINERQSVQWSDIFAKNSIWSYEQETRFIIQRTPKFKQVGNQQKFLVKLNENAINGVVFPNRFYNDEDQCFACKIIKAILTNRNTVKWKFYHLRKSVKQRKLEPVDISDLIHKTAQYYQTKKAELEEITQDLLSFFKEQNDNFFESTSDPKHAFKELRENVGAETTEIISKIHQNNGRHLKIDSNFNQIPDSLSKETIDKIIKDPDLINNRYPLNFFRILKNINPSVTYEVKQRNKRKLKNFGFELKYDDENASWNTVITKVPTL